MCHADLTRANVLEIEPLRKPRTRHASRHRLAGVFAAFVVAFRIPILVGWIAAAVLATPFLPALSASGSLGGLVSGNSPAVRAEMDAARLFGVPLASAEVELVQRDRAGFPPAIQTRVAHRALAVDQGRAGGIRGLEGALPVTNTGGGVPSRGAPLTTIVTFLFFRPGTTITAQTSGGETYAHRYLHARQDHLVGVTGPVPAEDAQTSLIRGYLPWVEGATLLAIGLIVGIYFRSVGAPLASLACSAVAYLVAVRLVGWVAHQAGLTVPPDLEPVLVVLLLGVTTDYSVFFLAGMRTRLASGLDRVQAARHTTAEFAPIIVTAGFVVTAGIASLGVARIGALQAFGPALALTVLIGMVVAVTLAPAIIAIFGGLLFRGRRLPRAERPRQPGRVRDYASRAGTTRAVAALATLACVVGLALGALGLTQIRLGFPLIRALPATAQAAGAESAASKGFVPGILAPPKCWSSPPA